MSFGDPVEGAKTLREMDGKYVGNRPCSLKRSGWEVRILPAQDLLPGNAATRMFSCPEIMLSLCSNGIKRSSVSSLDTRRIRITLEAQSRRNLASCTARLVMGGICISAAIHIPKMQGGSGALH